MIEFDSKADTKELFHDWLKNFEHVCDIVEMCSTPFGINVNVTAPTLTSDCSSV